MAFDATLPALYAGFGCRRGCPADTLENLLRQALADHGLALSALRGIASIALKADEPGLQQLAKRLGLPLLLYDAGQLQPYEPLLSHRSVIAHATAVVGASQKARRWPWPASTSARPGCGSHAKCSGRLPSPWPAGDNSQHPFHRKDFP